MRGLPLEWTKGIHDPKKKEAFEATIRNSHVVLERLYDILVEREGELTSSECTVSDYDTPNWDVRQAHRNGERSQIRKLKDLLSFMKG
jgi:hypothetical protein